MTMTDIPSTEAYQIQQLTDRIATLNKEVDELVKDIQVIGEALMTEATNRGWCSDYEDFVENVNLELKRSSLTPRIQDFTASISICISYQSSPLNADDKIGDIMRALHLHGDNLGGELYTIGHYDIDHVEAD